MNNSILGFMINSLRFLPLTITVILTIAAILSLSFAQTVYIQTGYFFMLALVISYGIILAFSWREIRTDANRFWSRNWHGAVLAVLLASLVFASVPLRHRMLYDDLHLLAVAKEMSFQHKAIREQEVWTKNPEFVPAPMIEKRPLLFPFFISLLHTLSNYRPYNVFTVNYLALCGFLFGLYCFFRRYWTKTWSAAILLIVLAQPIVSLCATSGGFEICNLAFITLAFLSLRYFLDSPSTCRLQLLVFHLLLLSHIQYASVLFLIFILTAISLRGHIKKSFLTAPSLIPAAPLFLLPMIWQRLIMPQLQDPDYPDGTTTSAFGLKYLVHNTTILPRHFFDFLGGTSGLAGIINIAGVTAILILIIRFFWLRKSFARDFSTLIMSLTASLTTILFLVLLYYSGMDGHPMNGRLYLLAVVMLSIAPIVLAWVLVPQRRDHGAATLLLTAALFLFYFPVASANPIFHARKTVRELKSSRELNAIFDFWRTHPPKNNLIIYRACRHFSPFLNDAINFRTARKWKKKILEQHKQRAYEEIYVIQRVYYKTDAPFKEDAIGEEFPLVTLAKKKIAVDYYLRLSALKQTEPKTCPRKIADNDANTMTSQPVQ